MIDFGHPVIRPSIEVAHLDDEAVLYDTERGIVHHLNPTGLVIWERYAQGGTLAEMADDLAARHGADPDRVAEDIIVFLAQLAVQGLIELPGSGAAGTGAAPRPP